MNFKNIKAVLFDLDGTLTDSEKYYCHCWMQAFKKLGLKATKQNAYALRSLGRPYCFDIVKKWWGQKTDFTKIIKCRNDFMKKYYPCIKLKKGVITTLKYLKAKHMPIYIVTGNKLWAVDYCLDHLKIRKYIDKVLTDESVNVGKPNPKIYIKAFKSLKLKPKQCLIIEDSPMGVISACRSKANVVMIPDLTKPDKSLSKYKYVLLDNIKQITKLFK